jgi:hypothetical protein
MLYLAANYGVFRLGTVGVIVFVVICVASMILRNRSG